MSTAEKHSFQAEIQQVLDIVIHSLYTDREIFVRELVSNAADACEKLRFLQTSGQQPFQPEIAPAIQVTADEAAGTLTILDTGIGMTRSEIVENLGTIAHSGTRAFLKKVAEEKKGDAKLIGQFGVGFYSAFMGGKRVTVWTRSHNPEESGWKWTSEGAGGYELEPAADLPRGTKIVVELKEDSKEFAKKDPVERIIKRYSNFVQFPIEVNGTHINTMPAIWARPKNEIKPEEYSEFYKYTGHDSDEPLFHLHFSADAPLSIQALLFVPKNNLERAGMMRMESEVGLYCKKVLIKPHCKELFPEWLRFLRGVVDSEDMPLHVSRETMQDSALMQKLNKVLTARFLKFLEEQAEKNQAAYETFYKEYSRFLKEGVATDFLHRDALGKLLRFESSKLDATAVTSLADYVKRMPEAQKEIYCIMAPNRESALSSPYCEVFKARDFEVLLLSEPIDEFVVEHLREFSGKEITLAEKAELDLPTPPSGALTDEQATALAGWLKETLGAKVDAVKPSRRLVESPAVVVDSDRNLTSSMKRLLKTMSREPISDSMLKQELQINPAHPVIMQLEKMRGEDPALAAQVAEQVLDNARVAAGLLDDPRAMLARLNSLLERVLTQRSPAGS